MSDALNRVAKWRTIFAGWQLGTRAKGDPECDAVRDHREATILLRAEMSALVATLVEAGVMDVQKFVQHVENEADLLSMAYEARFPGVVATDMGLSIDPSRVADWMKGWKP